ncbi:hypothetical protein QJS10_CPA10g01724 [Acorus calamus]|uniref:Uncharacterized protein n=1 Tax=Acorus calamus TaxID=4465 RepID=A0AAV9E0G3_ACOCL|nr:hypothetical protein QJS10_CPA10g01724 [Acorus calamus]
MQLMISTAFVSVSGSTVAVEGFGFKRLRTADVTAALGRWEVNLREKKAVLVMTEVLRM